ncbi:hypothetical protein [Nostoc sp.]
MDKLRNLTPLQLQTSVKKCIEAYKLAVDFLVSELPFASNAYLPYNLQLTLLVEFFMICPHPSIHQRDTLKKWFWHTSFSAFFRASNYTLLRGALVQVREFANNKVNVLEIDKNINYQNFVNDTFSLNKASSKSFILLLAKHCPKSILDGSSIDIYKALSIKNQYEFHHIFPKNFLKQLGTYKTQPKQYSC